MTVKQHYVPSNFEEKKITTVWIKLLVKLKSSRNSNTYPNIAICMSYISMLKVPIRFGQYCSSRRLSFWICYIIHKLRCILLLINTAIWYYIKEEPEWLQVDEPCKLQKEKKRNSHFNNVVLYVCSKNQSKWSLKSPSHSFKVIF